MRAIRALFSNRPAVAAKAETKPAAPPAAAKAASFARLPEALQTVIRSYTSMEVVKVEKGKQVLDKAGKPIPEKNGKQTLVEVNRDFNRIFKSDLLAERIVCGDLNRVKGILKEAIAKGRTAVEQLLLPKKTVVDYSKRPIRGAPLQLAWGAGDPETIAEIKKALLTLPNGARLIKAQYDEQFSADWQAAEEKEWAPIIAAMEKVFIELERSPNEAVTYNEKEKKFTIHRPELKKVLDEFRNLLAIKMQECVTTGRHFNPVLWLEAVREYDDEAAWARRGGYGTRNNLAWCQIIGFIQRYLPAVDAMATAQGIYYIVENREELRRSFKFRFQPDVAVFPLQAEGDWVLGENWAAGGGTRAKWPRSRRRYAETGKLISIKNSKLAGLIPALSCMLVNSIVMSSGGCVPG